MSGRPAATSLFPLRTDLECAEAPNLRDGRWSVNFLPQPRYAKEYYHFLRSPNGQNYLFYTTAYLAEKSRLASGHRFYLEIIPCALRTSRVQLKVGASTAERKFPGSRTTK